MSNAGYGLEDIRRFMWSDKKSTTRQEPGRVRDSLYKDKHSITYQVWGNPIARYNAKKNRLTISDAGYRTQLTKNRLNKVLGGYGNISQKRGEWFFTSRKGTRVPFKGMMSFKGFE